MLPIKIVTKIADFFYKDPFYNYICFIFIHIFIYIFLFTVLPKKIAKITSSQANANGKYIKFIQGVLIYVFA